MKHWISLSMLSTAAILAGCGAENQYVDFGLPKVKVMEVGSGTQGDNLYFPAVANAAERSHLSFRVAGEISELNVKEGDQVKKGDVLAKLDPTDYKLAVDNASAKYSVVDSQYKRSKPLVDKGLLAKSQFDEIAANRQIAFAELRLAQLRLSFTELLAPVDGIISRVSVDQFENVQVGQQVVNIHSLENVEVLIQLPDRLYVNQPDPETLSRIQALVKVPSGNEYSASIKEFTTEPDPATGTFTVTLSLPMPDEEFILDGMAVEVTSEGDDVGLSLNAGVLVPIEAVFNADGDDIGRSNKYVWVLNDGNTVSKQAVTVGKVTKNDLQILDGLESKQQVVVAGISRLREGMKVEIVHQEAGND
ncbi:efflux RND transporter periplasmic adaptor subunit [Vibrio neptunius]|uniref:Efflux RND transporter periplasmic adaptor subunit n=1 Tax=Vibrio neptunius TaxID=170651 RepID=A0ABS3A012_9VIBR|nr:efflux RND transporter periplasmic adaptor subunit [Vibrio neptunius]MBN3493026.1 efflux RND transporter periplasmic adaptor subunit [Vibrio neptunius]MBN3515522.1 efflux RND transporter periplasmic adaptor subunit [Vibrio neptunius]MBN3549558.1 efflux RND transporter periplasmic adaptor subunit [Vibrio neptunius]MBN3577841.1 efflux RND transporter periplasmic adaptor subunit [Vibrio neptunius]MCH9871505.1 efflux RND transporter periplasmic adaptor subunit [Vibrio neptunius]